MCAASYIEMKSNAEGPFKVLFEGSLNAFLSEVSNLVLFLLKFAFLFNLI